MNSLICRLFVRDWENTDDPDVRQRYGKLAGALGIISNSILCIAKIITGIIAGSIAGGLLVVYLCIAAFFIGHFFINTTINGKDFSGRTAAGATGSVRKASRSASGWG